MTRDISHLAGDLTKRVNRIDAAITKGRKDVLRAGGLAAKVEQLKVLSADSGGDLRLSRVRSGKGAKIGARYDITGDTGTVKATGPVQLLANRTKAHRIPKKANKLIVIPGIGVRAYADHPGTSGKDSWNKGRDNAEPKVRAAVSKATDEVIKRAFLSGG
jgi:hypothetical protein